MKCYCHFVTPNETSYYSVYSYGQLLRQILSKWHKFVENVGKRLFCCQVRRGFHFTDVPECRGITWIFRVTSFLQIVQELLTVRL
jgi:hypothetical protein